MSNRPFVPQNCFFKGSYNPEYEKLIQTVKVKCHKYNQLCPDDIEGHNEILKDLIGKLGKDAVFVPPFWCDYGYNIEVGDYFYANHNCVIQDGSKVTFGDYVFIAPNCTFTTAEHAIDPEMRKNGIEISKPITIGNNVWIGANSVILAGVTIGDNSVIGAGSVVNKDIPSGVVAVGVPCKVLREITEEDKYSYPVYEGNYWILMSIIMKKINSKDRPNDNGFRKELLSIAVPITLQNLMIALVGASDALMLGRLSQNSVSAVSLANQVSFIMTIFVGSIAGGIGTLVAQYYGKKDNDTVKRLMSIGISLCAVTSIIFFFVTFFIPETLMRIYTTDAELIATGSEYLKIVSFSYLMSGVTQIYLTVMKITDRAKMSAIISIMTVLIDMGVDFFLIYGIAGFPRMEVKGCAVSTVAVETCALLFCVIDSYINGHFHPDGKSFFNFSKLLYKDAIKITAPMLLSYLAWGVGYSIHSVIMGRQGQDAIAAFAIIAVIQELVVCFCKGLSSASSIMIGQLLGQNLMNKAKELGAKFCKIAILCGIFNAILLLIAGPVASKFFILTDEARVYFIKMLFVLAVYLFAYSLNTIIVCGVFPAGGDTAYDTKTVFISMWCVSLPLALLGSFVFRFSPMVVFILVMCDEIIKIPWIFPRYKKYIWLKNLTRD